ncbi:MAG: AraC family transcriptional regulator [Salinisphaera sp.]|nr:AraC family transcriptional regulator [Salinisphaera sp.]
MPTSSSHYFKQTIVGAERVGIDGGLLLHNVGLTREQIFDPNWRGDVELLARLVQLVWYALDDEFMGYMGRPAKLGTFAMMTRYMIHAQSLHQALARGILFYELFTDQLIMHLDRRGDALRLTVQFARPELDPAHYFIEFWLTIWYRLIGWLGGALPPLHKATFAYPYPMERIEEFKYLFRCPHEFEAAATALYLDADFLQRPIVRDARELKRFLSVAPLGVMMIPGDDLSLSRRIRTLVYTERGLPLDFPNLEEIADNLAMTSQTLRRRLKQESSSYRAIKESIRRDLAMQKLIESRLSIQAIGSMLGYSETRAFTRAFRQWTGLSPGEYRARLRKHFRA